MVVAWITLVLSKCWTDGRSRPRLADSYRNARSKNGNGYCRLRRIAYRSIAITKPHSSFRVDLFDDVVDVGLLVVAGRPQSIDELIL